MMLFRLLSLLLGLCWGIFLSLNAIAAESVFTPAQRQWIEQHREIRVAPVPDFEPVDFVGADGRHRGLAAEYLKLISTRTGLNFRIVRVKSRAEAMDSVRQTQVDMLASAFSPLASSSSMPLLTAPYLRLSAALYVRSDDSSTTKIDQLAGRKLAMVTDHVWQAILGDSLNKVTLIPYPTLEAALRALAKGEVDAYAGDSLSAGAVITRAGLGNQITLAGQLGAEVPVSFAVRNDWSILKEIIDTTLNQVTIDEEKLLRDRWLKNTSNADISTVTDVETINLAPSHSEEMTAALVALPNQRDLTTEQKQRTEEFLKQALADEQQADRLKEQWTTFRENGSHADAEARRLEETLTRDNTAELLAWRAALPERATIEQLEILLAREREALTIAHNAVDALTSELNQQTNRPAQISQELEKVRKQLAAVKTSQEEASSSAFAATVSRLRTQAQQRLSLTQIALLETENRTYESRMRLLSAQLRERQRQVAERTQRVKALENLVLDRTGAAVSETQLRLNREREELPENSSVLIKAADANITLGRELTAAVQRLGEIRLQKEDFSAARAETSQALANTEERLKIGGVNEAVGLILLGERRKLRSLPVLKHQLAALQTELAQARIRLIDLREQQTTLNDIGTLVNRQLGNATEGSTANASELHRSLYRLLSTRAELVTHLTAIQSRLSTALGEVEQELRSLTETTSTLSVLLDSHLLWTPSHNPVSIDWLKQLPQGFLHLIEPEAWNKAFQYFWQENIKRPFYFLIAFFLLLAFFIVRQRVPQWLELIATPMRRVRTDRYRFTGVALLLTLAAPLPLPIVFWLYGNLWQSTAESGHALADAIGVALITLVPTIYMIGLIHWVSVEKGLAHYHFRWPRARRESLSSIVRWFLFAFIPIQFLLALIDVWSDEIIIATIGRGLLAIGGILIALLIWRELRPGALWTSRDVVLREPVRLRQFTRVLFSYSCLFLTVLTLMGYFLTALSLAEHFLLSLGMLLLVALLHGLAVRWLVLGERRLALKRMEEKREAENISGRFSLDSGEIRGESIDGDTLTLASVNQQTRHLLRTFTLVGLASGFLLVWSDITPALSFLGNIHLWNSTQLLEGKEVATSISLLNLLSSALVLALTWVATRNLPGLLEVGLLRRLHMDAPIRYAITSVLRYLIVIFGTIFGIGLLGVHWNNLQWLAAGLTVGLGFGLQEIFANFVSGLIVLFERPIRIGDVITIGGVEGTVARIRTRATTIVDADNKEVVVPNKMFITERLINWTLSDTTTRLVIKVGVAYNSDPIQVQNLLLAIAAAHPDVLREPAPTCWMIGFGNSTLDFELRVFVAEIVQRQPVRTGLHMQIKQQFREQGIEIAFPQMDVWVHQASNRISQNKPAENQAE